MKISVVIPIYGCKKALPELYDRLSKTLVKISKNYEIILVNDNCPQNSWEIIEKLCKKDKKVVGINLSRNFGQMKAILAGLENASGEYIVVMDCDLQDRPEEIINLYNKLNEGYDVVFARRAKRKDSFMKKIISKIFYKIYSFATDQDYDETLCNFSISKRKVIESYCKMRESHRAFVMYIKWLGYKQTALDVEHNERYEGKSSYDFKKRFKMASDILFSQSDKILKFIVGLGFLITIFSSLFIIYQIIRHFISATSVMGWASIIVSIFFMGGLIMSVIGIVGLYVGNIFMQVKYRPLYLIRDILNGEVKK